MNSLKLTKWCLYVVQIHQQATNVEQASAENEGGASRSVLCMHEHECSANMSNFLII
jgi:hypothetical protein